MKAVSLWQPWATLIAIGAKRIETRNWPAPRSIVGQRIAIHAAKRTSELWICQEPPFNEYVHEAELPLGAVIATAVIARCVEMNELSIAELERTRPHEAAFGHYAIGRFAWVLRDVVQLPEPVSFRGAQGVFDVPDELLGSTPAQASLLGTPSTGETGT